MNPTEQLLSHRRRTERWILSQLRPYAPLSAMQKGSQPALLPTCFHLLTLHLLGRIEVLQDRERKGIAAALKQAQDPATGLCTDPTWEAAAMVGGPHDATYLARQQTMFHQMALSLLGDRLEHRIAWIDELAQPGALEGWLDGLDLADIWLHSNSIMFAGLFLTWAAREDDRYEAVMERLFAWLEARQDPATGFWGTDRGANLLHGMAGAWHLLVLYDAWERPLPGRRRALENTRLLQVEDGLFSPAFGGGACEDLDAIDTLVRFGEGGHRHLMPSLVRAARALLSGAHPRGGFSWVVRPSLHPGLIPLWVTRRRAPLKHLASWARFGVSRLHLNHRAAESQAYSSWDRLRFSVRQPDAWSTWFRWLALAEIDHALSLFPHKDFVWQFGTLPGMGTRPRQWSLC